MRRCKSCLDRAARLYAGRCHACVGLPTPTRILPVVPYIKMVNASESDTVAFRTNKTDAAHSIIERALALEIERPYIAFSGGKDSLVLAHLVHQHDNSIPLVYFDDELVFNELTEYVLRYRHWYLPNVSTTPLRIIQSRDVHAEWFESWSSQWGKDWHEPIAGTEKTWLRGGQNGRLFLRTQYDLGFVGLRRDEGKGYRREHLDRVGDTYRAYGFWHCQPLIDWTDVDVWEYIKVHDLPYCPVYDIIKASGGSPRDMRVGPLPLCPERTIIRGWGEGFYRRLKAKYGHRWLPRTIG